MRKVLIALPLAGSLLLAPTLAFAHVGVGDTAGAMHGFLHPLTGADHLIAMVMVGVLAFQIGGHARWLVPASFVGLMAVGGALGMSGMPLPGVETGIALSVLVLGSIVALGLRTPTLAAMALVGVFAVCHGHAHGAEMPESAGGLAYGAGFILATALLHVLGLGAGAGLSVLARRRGDMVLRVAGGLAAAAGLGLLACAL